MARKPTPNGPQFVLWMPRVLDCLRALGDSATSSEAIDWIGINFQVSEEERARVNKHNVRQNQKYLQQNQHKLAIEQKI